MSRIIRTNNGGKVIRRESRLSKDDKLFEWSEHMLGIKESKILLKMGIKLKYF